MADKTFEKVMKAFAFMFYPYNQAKMARNELNALRQIATKKNDGFQQCLTKFQNFITQSQAGDTPEVQRLFAKGLDIQITPMIYSMEKVPNIFKGWIDKVITSTSRKPTSLLSRKDMVYPSLPFPPPLLAPWM